MCLKKGVPWALWALALGPALGGGNERTNERTSGRTDGRTNERTRLYTLDTPDTGPGAIFFDPYYFFDPYLFFFDPYAVGPGPMAWPWALGP